MKNILLVCSAGMSTSLLVNKMQEAAKSKGIEVNINALPFSECGNVIDTVDIILLGPQVRFQKTEIKSLVNGRIPVEVIDIRAYGTMNGKAVLESALQLIEDHK